MRLLGYTLAIVLAVLLGGAGWLVWLRYDHPSLEPYRPHLLEREPANRPGEEIVVAFLGTATLLVTDGRTSLMTDGFFTRPGGVLRLLAGFGVTPDRDAIARGLARAGVRDLSAVLVVHSHYDHSMDAPEVAIRTGAQLVGSESTANVGRGWGLAEDRIRVVEPGSPMRFGDFSVTFLRSRHVPLPIHGGILGTEITEPLVPPAPITAYREGGTFSVLLEHPAGNLLVQGSAGYLPGALAGRRADVVFLSTGNLGGQDDRYRAEYFDEVALAVGARHVIPIHFDDFTLPLDDPPRPMPALADDVPETMDFLIARAAAAAVRFSILPPWRRVAVLPALSD